MEAAVPCPVKKMLNIYRYRRGSKSSLLNDWGANTIG
jgi:hypothetical protein